MALKLKETISGAITIITNNINMAESLQPDLQNIIMG